MIIDYQTVRETTFGRFIGCALTTDAELLTEADQTKLDVNLTVNGKQINFQRLFSAFDGSEYAEVRRPTPESHENVAEALEGVITMCEEIDNTVDEQCNEAIGNASSSYYCGEYASEAANNAGSENHPGDSVTDAVRGRLAELIEQLRIGRSQEAA